MGMTGATAPVTISGTLVQHVAENLLEKNPPSLPDKETQKALQEIMLSDAQKNDMPSLPEIRFP
jgi:hypothetical protein